MIKTNNLMLNLICIFVMAICFLINLSNDCLAKENNQLVLNKLDKIETSMYLSNKTFNITKDIELLKAEVLNLKNNYEDMMSGWKTPTMYVSIFSAIIAFCAMLITIIFENRAEQARRPFLQNSFEGETKLILQNTGQNTAKNIFVKHSMIPVTNNIEETLLILESNRDGLMDALINSIDNVCVQYSHLFPNEQLTILKEQFYNVIFRAQLEIQGITFINIIEYFYEDAITKGKYSECYVYYWDNCPATQSKMASQMQQRDIKKLAKIMKANNKNFSKKALEKGLNPQKAKWQFKGVI